MTAGITSYGYSDGSIPADKWGVWQKAAGAQYMVASPDDCVVSAVAGGTRQVQVGTGFLGGRGILDEITAPQTVTFDAVSSGKNYFLVKLTRKWQTTNESSVTVKNLGTSPTVARDNTTPGAIDDQPLSVWSLGANQTIPVLVKDLRAMGGPNFFVMQKGLEPADFSWLEQTGLTVHCGAVTWRRLLDPDSGNLIWDRDPTVWEGSGWLTESGLSTAEANDWNFADVDPSNPSHAVRTANGNVTVSVQMRRRAESLGSDGSPTGHIVDQKMTRIAVAKLRPSFNVNCDILYTYNGGSFHGHGEIDAAGFVWITDIAPNTMIATTNTGGWSLRATASYNTGA